MYLLEFGYDLFVDYSLELVIDGLDVLCLYLIHSIYLLYLGVCVTDILL